MAKNPKEANHVTTNTGTLHSHHETIDQANSAASEANKRAAALGLSVTYVAVDHPYSDGE